uniref:Muscle LIM protein Mlp84B n=1 Tax=Cacopsylla melanoneura TaxID=428564 RepID=A0A8D8TW69_9HEMI
MPLQNSVDIMAYNILIYFYSGNANTGCPHISSGYSCSDCHRFLDSTNLNDAPDGDIYCRSCYGKHFGPKACGFGLGASFTLAPQLLLQIPTRAYHLVLT